MFGIKTGAFWNQEARVARQVLFYEQEARVARQVLFYEQEAMLPEGASWHQEARQRRDRAKSALTSVSEAFFSKQRYW
jgi:transposase